MPLEISSYLEEKGVHFNWGYGGMDGVYFSFHLYDVPRRVYDELIIPHVELFLKELPTTWRLVTNFKSDADDTLLDPIFSVALEKYE